MGFSPPGGALQIETAMRHGMFNFIYTHEAGYNVIHAHALVDIDVDGNNALVSIAINRPVMEAADPNNAGDQVLSGTALGELYQQLCQDYPIVSIEDPFDQDDWENYAKHLEK